MSKPKDSNIVLDILDGAEEVVRSFLFTKEPTTEERTLNALETIAKNSKK